MKIITSFFKTCTVTFLTSMIFAGILFLLHLDLLREYDSLGDVFLIGFLSSFATLFIYIFIYIPIYVFNKKEFNELDPLIIFQRYLFIVIAPFILLFAIAIDSFIKYNQARIV